uniref:Uncharacterized protein n=1 Tax=Picea glauca TaxID=3330 RepID=A0A101LW93_PICGL|nr:hypothetical protein ABT39_MTgene1603 [Picea glauca]QHR86544.1 hypothetical protein Q903MT_gene546 [Picea sitchensis]
MNESLCMLMILRCIVSNASSRKLRTYRWRPVVLQVPLFSLPQKRVAPILARYLTLLISISFERSARSIISRSFQG